MSGTSLDGIDIAIADICGSGQRLTLEVVATFSHPFASAVRELILKNSAPSTSSVRDISQLNALLAAVYAEAVETAAEASAIPLRSIDLVGSHGQTLHHVPNDEPCADRQTRSSLQVGDPAALAALLGIPTVGGFRTADMALGGQGAPLVPYFDLVYFAHAAENRLLLNLGGIANMTVIPAGENPGRQDDLIAFDSGPANMVIDILMSRLFDEGFDAGGAYAREGQIYMPVLESLLEDRYFERPPPKSTGREYFGDPFVNRLIRRSDGMTPRDMLATATELTALSIWQAYDRFIREHLPAARVIASGGGVRNDFLLERIQLAFGDIPVETTADHGLDPDFKEAVCFAVLAHEFLNGQPTSVPSVTGASRAALLGQLALPASIS